MSVRDKRNMFDNIESVAVDPRHLGRIVRHQSKLTKTEIGEDLRAKSVIAKVGFEAQRLVGFHRVHALVLKLIGFELVDEPDASALLSYVQEHAASFRFDLG